MSSRMRLLYALFVGYLADFTIGWAAVWLAPHTSDLTWRVYMAPGEWVVDPLRAPFVALLFWTTVFGAVWYFAAPLLTRTREAATA